VSGSANLERARLARSRLKRRSVEDALQALRREAQPITFLSVARRAEVSRSYLYCNFRSEIGEQRAATQENKRKIDGKVVPLRTMEQYRQIEAVLRNKLDRLVAEVKQLRAELRASTVSLERERGSVEYWREQYEAALARVQRPL
jgi:AraC-like DNA-binding protein